MHIAYILFIHFPQLKFKYSPGIKNQINSCFYIFLDFYYISLFLQLLKFYHNIEIERATYERQNGELGNGKRGVMGTRGINVGMLGIRVGMRGIRVILCENVRVYCFG